MRIAIDAMGGDYAPEEIVIGAIQYARENAHEIVLVGNTDALARAMEKHTVLQHHISIMPSKEIIHMHEDPAWAVRRKKDSSINVATSLLKNHSVDAVVSAGSTGACVVSSLMLLGRIEGVSRPAIATFFPSLSGHFILLDIGANPDCKPHHLLQFAHLGSLFCEVTQNIARPRVGLLNMGEEEQKGNETVQRAHAQLKKSTLNFIGNVEGKDLLFHKCDVAVCDGFTGNLILKFGEGVAEALFQLLKEEFTKTLVNKMAAAVLLPSLKNLKDRLDYQNTGGAMLLGVKGNVVIAHGRSKAPAVKSAIEFAARCASTGLVDKIKTHVSNSYPHFSWRLQ